MIFMKNKNGVDIEITEKEIEEFENKYNVELNKDVYDAILDKVFEILD